MVFREPPVDFIEAREALGSPSMDPPDREFGSRCLQAWTSRSLARLAVTHRRLAVTHRRLAMTHRRLVVTHRRLAMTHRRLAVTHWRLSATH
jgi:hypothetical protein